MVKDSLFNSEDIDSLIKLANLFTNIKPDNKVYKISPISYDYLKQIIKKDEKMTEEEKKSFLEKIDIRKRNQNKIEEISLEAENINRAEKLLKKE